MKKIDPVVAKQTLYVSAITLILSALMQAIFLISGFWDYKVLLGNILGAAVSILNFFLMGITVQSATSKEDEKDAKSTLRLSLTLRNFMLVCVLICGAVIDVFNVITVFVSVFFPKIAVLLNPIFNKEEK